MKVERRRRRCVDNRRDHAAAWLIQHRQPKGLARVGGARPVSEADLPLKTVRRGSLPQERNASPDVPVSGLLDQIMQVASVVATSSVALLVQSWFCFIPGHAVSHRHPSCRLVDLSCPQRRDGSGKST